MLEESQGSIQRSRAGVRSLAPLPPHPSSKATARSAPSASFPPTAAIEIHIFRGSAPRAPKLCAGTLPEHSRFSQTTADTVSPGGEISPPQTEGISSPPKTHRKAPRRKTHALPSPLSLCRQ